MANVFNGVIVKDVYTSIDNLADNNSIQFSAAGTSGITTLISGTGTSNLTMPVATDTLVARETTDALTNKTIDDASNSVRANRLATPGAPVEVDSTAPPALDYVLVTTTATDATWQAVATLPVIVSLQDAYDNSLASPTPEIVLDSTRGALSIEDNATPLGANLLEVSNNGGGITYFKVDANGVVINGNLDVNGTTTSINTENLLVDDNFITVNGSYILTSALQGGLAIQYSAVSPLEQDTVSAGPPAGFDSTITVSTTGAATFAAGDIISITGANNENNNGVFEVLTHAANVLTISSAPEQFARDVFTPDATVAGTITKVNIAAVNVDSLGRITTGSGSSSGIVYRPVGSDLVTSTPAAPVSVDTTTPSAAGEVLVTTSATVATWQDLGSLTGKSATYSIAPNLVSVHDTVLRIGDFTWDQSRYGSLYTSPVLVYEVEHAGDNITVDVFNATTATSLGSLTSTGSEITSFAFTLPVADANLQVRVNNVGAGFSGFVRGVQMEFDQ